MCTTRPMKITENCIKWIEEKAFSSEKDIVMKFFTDFMFRGIYGFTQIDNTIKKAYSIVRYLG